MSEARRRAGLEPDAQPQATPDAASPQGSPRLAVSAEEGVPAGHRPRPRAQLSAQARTRLTRLLIGKSITETLFVSALAVLFIHQVLHPSFRGSLDAAAPGEVSGWAVDAAAPGERVEVQLFIDEHFAGRARADRPRPDVLAAGRAPDEFHGFSLRPPPLPAGEHEARVYAVHRSLGGRLFVLRQVDKALRFNVPAGNGAGVPQDWWRASEQR